MLKSKIFVKVWDRVKAGFLNRGNEAVYINIFFNGVTIQKPSPRGWRGVPTSIVMVGAGYHPFSEETLGERQCNYILGKGRKHPKRYERTNKNGVALGDSGGWSKRKGLIKR